PRVWQNRLPHTRVLRPNRFPARRRKSTPSREAALRPALAASICLGRGNPRWSARARTLVDKTQAADTRQRTYPRLEFPTNPQRPGARATSTAPPVARQTVFLLILEIPPRPRPRAS